MKYVTSVFQAYRPYSWSVFLVVLAALMFGTTSRAFCLAFYTDSPGYPATWPASLATRYYTLLGQPQSDAPGSQDNSAGANPSGMVDFSSGASKTEPSFYYYGDGSILFFRFRVGGPPLSLTGNGQPFGSATWNVLCDTDGDGYKEFVVMLDGGSSGAQPDDIVVIYDNNPSQKFIIQQTGIWRQDSAGPSDGVDGGPYADLNADPYVWDFGRTRVVQLDTSKPAGSNQSEYFIDIQVPLSALNATAIGGPALSSSSLFSLIATSSNSNSDPTQKDVVYSGDLTVGDVTFPMGDMSNGSGSTFIAPVISSITATACPSPIILTAIILDALTTDPVTKQTKDTINSVVFEYYFDANGDGSANDSGQSWTHIGSASRTATLGKWEYSWDIGLLLNGSYLVRTIATDMQTNVTTSTSQPYLTPSSVTARVINVCSRIAKFDMSTKMVSDINGGQAFPGDILLYTITLKNTGGINATNVALRDTIPANTSYVPGSASPAPASTDPLVWNAGTLASGATAVYTFRVVLNGAIPNGAEIQNRGWISFDSGLVTGLSRMVSASITVASGPYMSFVKSVNKSTAAPGETIVYTITYSNIGSDSATEVWISDTAPPQTDYIANSVTVNGAPKTDAADLDGVTSDGRNLSIRIGTVPVGTSGQIQFQVKIR